MDKRLEEALEYSNYQLTLSTQKKNIKLRAEAIQLVNDSGGMFSATQEIILWTNYLINSNLNEYVLFDINNQPILVKDIKGLHDKLLDAYSKSTTLYYTETEKIKRARTVDKVVSTTPPVKPESEANDGTSD